MKQILISILFIIPFMGMSQTDSIDLKEFQVVGIRPIKSDPVSITTIETDSIRSLTNSGSDPFFILNRTVPNILSQSDNGSPYGYSYIRMRGMDQTRINFTLNGVPLNEMEDQGIYFSNMPGFFDNISRTDVIRGVGVSKYGTTSLVGSVNMETKSPLNKEIIGEIGLGSFNTNRTYLEYTSGLINKIAFSSSLGYLSTDGFRDNSGTDGYNYFGQIGYFGKRDHIKIYGFSGLSNNNLSFIPVDRESILINPRVNFNSIYDVDRFGQNFVSTNWSTSRIKNSILNTSIYFNNVNGFYDIDFGYDVPDIYRFGIKSYQGGAMSNLVISKDRSKINIGANYNLYQREHNMQYLDTTRYTNFGNKSDHILFTRYNYQVGNYNLFADIQYRGVNFTYKDSYNNIIDWNWNFINPKVGVKRITDKGESWLTLGRTSREVTRTDLFQTNDNVLVSNGNIYNDPFGSGIIDDSNLISTNSLPEIVNNLELGHRIVMGDLWVSANYYLMLLSNERLVIGVDDVYGLPIREVSNTSQRSGFEIESEFRWFKWKFGTNASYLRASIYNGNRSSFSPEFMMNNFISYRIKKASLGLNGQFVSEMYLNNEERSDLMTDSYYLVNMTIDVKVGKSVSLSGMVNNILDSSYLLPGGVLTGSTFRLGQYFPGAGRNYFMKIRITI